MNTLKKILIIVIYAGVVQCYAQPPFEKGGAIHCRMACIGNSGNMPQFVPENITKSYIEDLGAYPDYIRWTSMADSANIVAVVDFDPSGNWLQNPAWWGDSLTYGQLRPYLRAYMISMENGDSISLTLPQDSLDTIISTGIGSYQKIFSIQFDNLPIPSGESAWEIHLVSEVSSDSVATYYNSVIVAKKAPESTLDSLVWSLGNDDSNVSMAFKQRILTVYPNYIKYLGQIFYYYYLTSPNCDSVSFYGDRVIDTIEGNLDFVQAYRDSLSPSTYDDDENIIDMYKDMIDDICIDGYPQPEKYEIPRE